jgi:hypothetical protein
MVRWLVALAFLLVFALSSLCPAKADDKDKDKDKDKTKMMETDYYPLQEKSSWTYKAGDNTFKTVVAKIESFDNRPCARLEMTSDDKVVAHEHVYVTADGVYRASFSGTKPEKPVLFLKLPPKAGDTWTVDTKALNEPLKGTFKIAQEPEVKVPAGTYKNVVVVSSSDLDANGLKFQLTSYFAEKVGLIKEIIDVGGQKTTIELQKYEPAKQ